VRLRNLAEMFLLRGFQFTHEAVRDWEARFAPLLAEQLRRRRKGKVACRWYVDETYLKVKGKWSYLYRAINGAGNLVDSMLSATRDMAAAQRFFRGTLADQTGSIRTGTLGPIRMPANDWRRRFADHATPPVAGKTITWLFSG
jgi:transposase-like protein